jgi:AcrR family transcriptional regulator
MTSVNDRLAACRQAITDLLRSIDDLPNDDIEGIAEGVLALDTVRQDLAAVRDAAETRLVTVMGEMPEVSIAGATMELRRSDSRKAWDHKAISAEVAERLVQSSVDFETGEMLKSTEELIMDVLTYAGVSYWKVKALNNLGISADDYCEVTEGAMKVRINRV